MLIDYMSSYKKPNPLTNRRKSNLNWPHEVSVAYNVCFYLFLFIIINLALQPSSSQKVVKKTRNLKSSASVKVNLRPERPET